MWHEMLACRDSIRKPLLLRRQTFGELGKRAHNSDANDANDTVSISEVHIIKTHQHTTSGFFFVFVF